MWRYYELLSFRSVDDVQALRAGHPKEAKVALAREIVARFHGAAAAEAAHAKFSALFKRGGRGDVPDDAPTITLSGDGGAVPIVRALVEAQLVKSNSEARRLIGQNGLFVDGTRIESTEYALQPGEHAVRAGKKSWARVIVQ
jgi:tyrosyl-tRNA synthetase